jgi:hypothetical protein
MFEMDDFEMDDFEMDDFEISLNAFSLSLRRFMTAAADGDSIVVLEGDVNKARQVVLDSHKALVEQLKSEKRVLVKAAATNLPGTGTW